jgi:hypothetical protein
MGHNSFLLNGTWDTIHHDLSRYAEYSSITLIGGGTDLLLVDTGNFLFASFLPLFSVLKVELS